MKTPQNQKRLTNVAIVRYKKGGQRVEVACYPNTVESWREKIETNLDEVLQSRQLFVNVSKGELAKWELVEKAFGTSDETAILSEILQRGELQVGEKEREAALAKMRKEIASSLAGMSVNPGTMRPYPVTIIEKVMKDVHFKPDPKKAAKTQAKELLGQLEKDGQLPIQRAKMRLKITVAAGREAGLRQGLEWDEESRTQTEEVVELVGRIRPGLYRQVEETARREAATVLVVSLAVTAAGGAGATAEQPLAAAAAQDATVAPAGGKELPAKAPAPEKSRRAQKGEQRLQELMGVVEEDDDDWKNDSKKKGGKGGKKKKGK